jgi:hypothetical protein
MSKPRAILVPGFNDASQGENNIDKLKPLLQVRGYRVDTELGDYGWKEIFGVWVYNSAVAHRLIENHQEGDIYIGYSNGCSILARAIDMGLPAKYCIFIHPALRADWQPPKSSPVTRIDVFSSFRDNTARIAGWLQILTQPIATLKSVYWGRMGTCGTNSGNRVFYNHNDGYNHYEWAYNKQRLTECIKYIPKVQS